MEGVQAMTAEGGAIIAMITIKRRSIQLVIAIRMTITMVVMIKMPVIVPRTTAILMRAAQAITTS